MSTSKEHGKQYGLILSKKGAQEIIQRPSIFEENSDSEDSGTGDGNWIKKAYQRETKKSVEKKQTKIQIEKALAQDPSIYQYDELYEDMKEKTVKEAPKKDEKKQSRYIQSLKRNAERRKLENERRMERQVQKERQAEGEEFQDKETFVTSSYKKKLEEFQKMDEEEKRMDRLEEIGDVSKQKDISGFYRHLYKTTVDVDQPKNEKTENTNNEESIDQNIVSPAKDISKEVSKDLGNANKLKRHYRKRKNSRSSKEEGEKTSSSSESSSSSSSESGDDKTSKAKREVKSPHQRNENSVEKKNSSSKEKAQVENIINLKELKEITKSSISEKETNKKSSVLTEKEESTNEVSSSKVNAPEEEKINIWLKRTVGSNYDDALRRYLERKSKRQGSY